ERMIALVDEAERFLRGRKAWVVGEVGAATPPTPERMLALADLRRTLSAAAGAPMLLSTRSDARALAFARRPDLAALAGQGPATPDHIIRTKRTALLGRDVAAYAAEYKRYFDTRGERAGAALDAHRADAPGLVMLDPAPRIVVDAALGVIAAGRAARDAAIGAELYAHTMDIYESAEALGGWRALPPAPLFDVEYWDLEQAKLRRGGAPPALAGEVALVTGAASGIGKACVEALLKRGAAVVGIDLKAFDNPRWRDNPAWLGVQADITDEAALRDALAQAAERFGGLDMLVLNAGIFPKGAAVAELDTGLWRKVMAINVDANLALLREAHPLLARAPRGGRVVVIGSKNVPAPGPGAAAYSASKAALTQLARVAALEWGADGIRVNVIHPNAVFDTGLWTEEVLASRAASYGLSVQAYKTNNVLRAEVRSADVAELAAEMLGPLFSRTTGAQVPIDGGNDRVI
ncbi:MAG: SDR family oxidoreductase, partial [Thermoflexales bacterium]|nr:SDR family oxidoreductase [Thermoflexales bacterium]